MRAAPPLRIVLRTSPLAGAGVVALAALAAGVAAAWSCDGFDATRALCLVAALGAGCLAVLCALAMLARIPERTLDWDARQWRLVTAGSEEAGEIAVAMDVGSGLLLRFRPLAAPRRARWIALSRRGLEAQWHGLRCALYSPRPGAAASDPSTAANSQHERP
jgi:hypothetical protein